jgi:hypothetical protein
MDNPINALPLILQHGIIRSTLNNIIDMIGVLINGFRKMPSRHPSIHETYHPENSDHAQNKIDRHFGAQADLCTIHSLGTPCLIFGNITI